MSGKAGPTLVLLNDCRDQLNYGAKALVEGLIYTLRRAIPDHVLRVVPSHWVYDAQRGFKGFDGGDALRQPQALWPEVADQFEPVADEWLSGRGGAGVQDYLQVLRGADVVVLNGEGSMYRTNLSAVRELYLAWFAKTRLGIPTLFLNGLIHLTRVTPILTAMMRKTFVALDAVAVRDPWSQRNIAEYLPEIPVRMIPDSAFALPSAQQEPGTGVQELLGALRGSEFICFDPGPMPIDHRFGSRSALYSLITEMKGLVSQVVMTSSGPYEEPMLARLAAETRSLLLEQQPSYLDLMAVLQRARFQISGRLHNGILGSMVGCPAISIASTSHKVHGSCETLRFPDPFDGTDLRSATPAMLLCAQRLLAGGDALRAEIKAHAARLGEGALELGSLVAEVLNRHRIGAARAAG